MKRYRRRLPDRVPSPLYSDRPAVAWRETHHGSLFAPDPAAGIVSRPDSDLASALPDRFLSWIRRVAASAVAVFVALRLTDEFITGLGAAVVLAVALDLPWWLYDRLGVRSEHE